MPKEIKRLKKNNSTLIQRKDKIKWKPFVLKWHI